MQNNISNIRTNHLQGSSNKLMSQYTIGTNLGEEIVEEDSEELEVTTSDEEEKKTAKKKKSSDPVPNLKTAPKAPAF